MMSQETTAPLKLHVENSWKDGGLFPIATPISHVFAVSTTDASSDQAMSAEAMNVAAGMAVLSQGKDFHSFIRCVCACFFDVHVERCVVQCVCDCHIKPIRVPLCAFPPAFILYLYLFLCLYLMLYLYLFLCLYLMLYLYLYLFLCLYLMLYLYLYLFLCLYLMLYLYLYLFLCLYLMLYLYLFLCLCLYLMLYLYLYLFLACFHPHCMPTQPRTCASLSMSLQQLRKQERNDSSSSSSKNASAGDAPELSPNAPQSPAGTCLAH
jgi:hypothetical protein